MALEDFFVPVSVQDWRSKPDGFGGVIWGWEDGTVINVGIAPERSFEARMAEAQGVKSTFTVTMRPNVNLEHEDVIRRLSDGALFRIASNPKDTATPMVADEQYMEASAERVDSA